MFQVGLDKEVPYNRFKEYLEEGNWIYVAEERLNNAVKIIDTRVKSRFKQLVTCLYGVTGMKVHTVSKFQIIEYLIETGVPEEYFCKRGDYEPKYYNQKVRTKIITNGYTCEAFFLYEDYQKLKKMASSIRNVIRRQMGSERISGNNGEVLIKVPYDVIPTKNRRFSTANENTIGFYGELRSAFAAPEDSYILSCDFPQIDARAAMNMYLKNDRLDKLSEQVDDTYLLFKEYARYIAHQHDLKTLEDASNLGYYVDTTEIENRVSNFTDDLVPFPAKAMREIYKVTALKTAYYSRYSTIPAEGRAMRDLTLMYESTERYKRILSMTQLMFNMKIPIEVKSRWGDKRLIVERDMRSTLSSVFNAPIQTTSSEAIIFYVVHFLDYFRKQGHGPEDVRICLNRHDEPIFYIKKELFNQHIQFIAGMRTYLIEGWAPMTLDMFVGDYYKENLELPAESLERVPMNKDRAMLEANSFRKQEEPYALIEPQMFNVSHRKMNDGHMRVAFVYNVGSLPKELILQKDYEETRPFEVKVLSFKTDEATMSRKLLEQVTNNFSNMKEGDDSYLVLAPYGHNEDTLLEKRTAHFRNFGGTTGHLLAQAVLAKVAEQLEPETLTDNDRQSLLYLEANKWRFEV